MNSSSAKLHWPLRKSKLLCTITNDTIIGLEEHFFGAVERFTTIWCKSGTGKYFKLKKDIFFAKT